MDACKSCVELRKANNALRTLIESAVRKASSVALDSWKGYKEAEVIKVLFRCSEQDARRLCESAGIDPDEEV